MDEWLPIIGPVGYMLYSLYVRMASRGDENSFPGYRMIQAHLGIGSASISDYNKLLVWCGLIHIQPGTHTESNDYYILPIPEVTSQRLEAIRQQAQAELSQDSKFLACVLGRLEEWQPLQAHWGKQKPKPIVIHPAQISLPLAEHQENLGASVAEHPASPAEQGAPPAEHPASPAEQGASVAEAEQSKSTIQNNNPNEHGGQDSGNTEPPSSPPAAPDIPASGQSLQERRKAAIQTYLTYSGLRRLDTEQARAIADLASSRDFDQTRWEQSCRDVKLRVFSKSPGNIGARIDVYNAGGTVQALYDQQRQPAPPAQGQQPGSTPPNLDPEKLAAYQKLQAQAREVEAHHRSMPTPDYAALEKSQGVDVAGEIGRLARTRRV